MSIKVRKCHLILSFCWRHTISLKFITLAVAWHFNLFRNNFKIFILLITHKRQIVYYIFVQNFNNTQHAWILIMSLYPKNYFIHLLKQVCFWLYISLWLIWLSLTKKKWKKEKRKIISNELRHHILNRQF